MKTPSITFELPESLNASMPPERRGVRRDHVRLMVLDKLKGTTQHDLFYHLNNYLSPGDLLVFNSSRTIPAHLRGRLKKEGCSLFLQDSDVRLAQQLESDLWEALPLSDQIEVGDTLLFSKMLEAVVIGKSRPPLVHLKFSKQGSDLLDAIYRIGEPIRYEYSSASWDLDYYQTVYATAPGSVEMPSAGRAFSWELLFKLQSQGIQIAFLQLQVGLSYLMDDGGIRNPRENVEHYQIPMETIRVIQQAKETGRRIIAVGTTVVRTLETAFDQDAQLISDSGWTNLYINRETKLKIPDGLITGFHEPEASHLDLLSAFVDQNLLCEAYQEAVNRGYLWHEFGDVNLIL